MNPITTTDGQVDQIIGSAYQVIKYVASNMETLITLAKSIDPLVNSMTTAFEALRRTYQESGYELLEATFTSGAAIGTRSHVLLDDSTGIAYSWGGALPKYVPEGSTVASTGGVGEYAWVPKNLISLRLALAAPGGVQMVGGAASQEDVAEVELLANKGLLRGREALRRTLAEAGFNLVDGSFEIGGVVTTSTDVLLYETDGKAYLWKGTYPKTVPAASTPASAGGVTSSGWELLGNTTLREELDSGSGSTHVSHAHSGNGAVKRTVAAILNTRIDVKGFGAVGDGVTDDTMAFNRAVAHANLLIGGVEASMGTQARTVTILVPPGVYAINGTVLVLGNMEFVGDSATIVSSSNNPVFESAYINNGVMVSNSALSDLDAISHRLIGLRFKNLTFYGVTMCLRLRAVNEQCALEDCRFYFCGTSFEVTQGFFMNYRNITIRNVKQGLENTFAVVLKRATNRVTVHELCIAGRSNGAVIGEQGTFAETGSSSIQWTGGALEALDNGIKFMGSVANVSISGVYIEEVSNVFYDTDDGLKYNVSINDCYSYGSAYFVDFSGLRDSYIGPVTDRKQPETKAIVRLRQGVYGNQAVVELPDFGGGGPLSARYAISDGVIIRGTSIKYTSGATFVALNRNAISNNSSKGLVPVYDRGQYGVATDFVVGAADGSVTQTAGTEVFVLTNFKYSEYTALTYSIKITPNTGSGSSGTTPAPVYLKGVVIGDSATQIASGGRTIYVNNDPTHNVIRLHFTGFGSSSSDPDYAWMRNGLYKSEGIIKLIA